MIDLNRERHLIGVAVMRACEDLPEGWTVRVDLENGAGTVELINPDGYWVDLDLSLECFSDEINAAIDHALAEKVP
ncbi:MAG: hypothetical protein CML17_10055 [Pusillimonas sp.]|nr:hypothetical protein [Pusillimonas sp.]